MRIFITGGTGFIGNHTVKELKRRGHTIFVLTDNLSDVNAWKGRLKKFKPETAIHLAWEGIPDFSYAQCAKNLQYGIGLFNVLAEIGCKKVIVAGTGFECGSRVGRIPDEFDAEPTTAFTVAKRSLHRMGEQMAKERGMDFIWLRPYNPYGDGQRVGSLIPYIMSLVAKQMPLTLRVPLAQGDFIYITDVARIIADAVTRGKGIVTYNVGSGYLTPVREIARIICKGMGASDEYYRAFVQTAKGKLLNAAYADLKNVHKDLGWRPTVAIKQGIKKTIQLYESHHNRV